MVELHIQILGSLVRMISATKKYGRGGLPLDKPTCRHHEQSHFAAHENFWMTPPVIRLSILDSVNRFLSLMTIRNQA